jgi:CPA1 family monovalent cation:H+ antiporter
MARIDFNAVLLHGMLAFLLFAGSLHVDLSDLGKEWLPISLLAVVGTAASTFIVGGLMWGVLWALGLGVPVLDCLLFGALISPTDPIAVLGIMKQAGTPKRLETLTAGESLFNDGVGVVIFLALLELAVDPERLSAAHVGGLLLREAAGGVAVGMVTGYLVYQMLKRVDNYQVEVLLTLSLAMGGYALADALHVSAPIATVVSGLFIGNQGRHFAMSRKTEEHLDTFWELIDEILNALLFLLIGMEVLIMPFPPRVLWAGAAGIAVTLLARWLSVAGIVAPLRRVWAMEAGSVRILTWGGLRGGISVAMALSLPAGDSRNLLLAVTYCVVVFSVFGQGLTMSRVIRRVRGAGREPPAVVAAGHVG